MSSAIRTVSTAKWALHVPKSTAEDAPLICIPTIHPRGDQRILRCTQVLLDAGFRVKFIWEGLGKPSADAVVSEELIAPSHSLRQRLIKLSGLTSKALHTNANNWHIHDFYMLPSALLASARGVRTIYDVHEYYPEYYASKLPMAVRPAVRGAIAGFQSSVARIIGGVNVVSAAMTPEFDRKGIPTAITPNYPYRMLASKRDAASRSGAIHIGTLSETYGMEQLISIGEHLADQGSDISLDLIKKFPNKSTEQAFFARLNSSRASSVIRLIDPVRPTEIPSLLDGYAVGLSTILNAGQNDIAVPTKLYEYVLAGVTVIGTRRSAQQSFMENWGQAFLFEDEDTRGMAKAIIDAHRETTKARSFQAAQEADGHLSWELGPAKSLTALAQIVFHGGRGRDD
ncbi:hypothetical protein [Citricoccus nitrophenolicus]|uniref:hypothetical protein n=1 Tax=Citricoccus nitrophenolicus TaxID=863575 RepID=UPI0031E58D33